MSFWLRNIVLGLFLSTLAWGFFINQELLLSLAPSMTNDEPKTIETSVVEVRVSTDKIADESKKNKEKKTQQGPTTTNAAALGLSKFYANLHGDMDGKGPKIRNNIVYLSEPKGDLIKLLQAREMVVRPYPKKWLGRIESRPFRNGETLNQKLAQYSAKEGIELIWWLNRDYIVKDPFRIEKNLLKTTFQVAKAIEGHFPSGLSIFFCARQRATVVIESAPHDYLDEECALLKSANAYY